MVRIEKTDGGLYVYDAPPIPDGTFIPDDYSPYTDNVTDPTIKEMVVKIMDYVSSQDVGESMYDRNSASEPTGAPVGAPRASSPNFQALEHIDNKAMGFLTKRWNWMDRVGSPATPAALASRAQKYRTKKKKKQTKPRTKSTSGSSRSNQKSQKQRAHRKK